MVGGGGGGGGSNGVFIIWCGYHLVWSGHLVWSSSGMVIVWCGHHVVWYSMVRSSIVIVWCYVNCIVALHSKLRDAAIIPISLHDATNLRSWEQDDPVGAVCRQIAFAAQLVAPTSFDTFRVHVSRVDIETWLGDLPCILLVDELNKQVALTDRSHPKCTEIGTFLKEVFLKPMNRYLIFSSHTIFVNSMLSYCMDSTNGRQIQIRQLPLIAG